MIEGWNEPLWDFNGDYNTYNSGFTCKECGDPRPDYREFMPLPHLCGKCWPEAAHKANIVWDTKFAKPLNIDEFEMLKEMIEEWRENSNADEIEWASTDKIPNLSPGEDRCPSGARLKEQVQR